MGLSFEDGVAFIKNLTSRKGDEAFFANAADPLHAAFAAKATVHAGPMGLPMVWGLARRKLEELSQQKRTAPSVAYIHVPFCETRCLYCMFYQNPYTEAASHHYADLLIKELQMWADRPVQQGDPVLALYFGGGTPSSLTAPDIERVVKGARTYLPLANDCEITLEGRVHDMTTERLDAAVAGGVNRISLGVQTFNDKIRLSMQRLDGRAGILQAVERIASYSELTSVIDMIFGFPGQTKDVWENDLQTARNLDLDGVDCYQLNLFAKSPLARQIAVGKFPPAATMAEAADCFARSDEVFFGDPRWTCISNTHWRRTPKERNIYNTMAKGPCDCLAFGCGAGGKLFGHAFMEERKLKAWEEGIERGEKPVFALMKPSARWFLMRTVASAVEQGAFNLGEIGEQFKVPIAKLAAPLTNQWVDAGLLTREGDWLKPTTAGRFWHVTMAQFLVESLGRHLVGTTVNQDGFGLPEQTREPRLAVAKTAEK